MKFMIYGYNGYFNTGDDAMLFALIQSLKESYTESEFSILSPISLIVPSQNVKFIKPSIFRFFKEITQSSTFIIGGGTHLFDYYGNNFQALKIQSFLFITVFFAKIFRKKVWILGNGLGPFKNIWKESLVKLTCQIADYVSVRDKISYELLEKWKIADKSSLAFDLALLMDLPAKDKSLENPKKILGISITPFFEIYNGKKEKDYRLVAEMSKHLNKWTEENPNAEVHLFIFHGPSKDDDVYITNLLKNMLISPNIKIIPYDPDPQKILSEVSKCNFFIGMKYHASIFAYMNNLPLLIISYHDKCYNLAKEISLPEYAIINPDDILEGKFGDYFKKMLENPEDFIGKLEIDIAKKRAKNLLI